MTLVNADTGEVVALDRAAAERRAERIRLRLDAIADNFTAVLPMIREAIEKRDDIALGYRSISEYVADRFGGALHNLPVGMRREAVGELTEAGLSTRAIAPVVGVSHEQARQDAMSAGVKSLTPEPVDPPDRIESDEELAEAWADLADMTEPEVEPPFKGSPAPKPAPPKPIIGIDGKNYPKPPKQEPAKPRRSSLPDAASKAGWELRKAIERVERIVADDRFPTHREQVAVALHSHLSYVAEVMPDLLDAMHQSQED